MKQVTLKIAPTDFKNPTVRIDGKLIAFKKQQDGWLYGKYSTEKDSVSLTVKKVHEAGSPLFWLYSFLFFVLGCFGIFDPHYDSKCRSVEYEIKLDLIEQTNLAIHFANFADGGRAVDCVRNCNGAEEKNFYYFDKKAKKRLTAFRIIKPFVWLGLIALLIYGAIRLIIG